MSDVERRQLEFEGFLLDLQQRRVSRSDGAPVELTPRTFDLLLCLAEHPGQLLDKAALLRTLWPDVVVEENSLNQAVSQLRRALGDSWENPRYIQTVPRRGFRFLPAVSERRPEAARTGKGAPPDSLAAPVPLVRALPPWARSRWV